MGDLNDPAAFRALFEAHFADVHRYLAHRLGDPGAAEDLAAETFLRAFRARRRFRAGSARAWLFTIATNLLRDEARGRGARAAALARVAEEPAAAPPDFELPDPELAAALAALRPEEREALLLFAWAELSYEEIAQATGVAVGTVRSRLSRARAQLAVDLAAEESVMIDVEERLRAAHERVPEPDAATAARVLARLEAELTPPRRRRRRLALALVVPAAAAAATALALLPGRVETPVTPPQALGARACFVRAAPPDSCLHALADVAAVQRALATGRVLYERNDFTLAWKYIGADGRSVADPDDAAYAIVRTVPEELWLAPDGSGRYVYGRQGTPHPASTADERAWRAAGAPDLETLMGPAEEDWGPKVQRLEPWSMLFNSNLEAVLPRDDPLSVLPHEPKALEAFLWRAARRQRPLGPPSNVRNTIGTDVTTFLRYPRTPPSLRAALLDVFAAVPGARLLGRIRDAAGRPAAAIDLPDDMNDGADVVAFDPATARLVAEGRSNKDGSVRWMHTYALSVADVARVGERP